MHALCTIGFTDPSIRLCFVAVAVHVCCGRAVETGFGMKVLHLYTSMMLRGYYNCFHVLIVYVCMEVGIWKCR